MKIQLPTGGVLVAPTDPTRDAPNDCSRVFSLLPLVASYLASTQCLLKVLELIGPLVDIVKALVGSPELAASSAKFLKVAQELVPCQTVATALGARPFVRDVLCLATQGVNCIIQQLNTLLSIMTGVATQLHAAQAARNTELVKELEAAQKNAQGKATALVASIQEVQNVLDLAGVYLKMAGVSSVQLASLPATTDLNSLKQLLLSLQQAAALLEAATDALGGCSGL
jgi:hypothetical protein